MLGGLKNCTDCKDFCLSVLQKFFLSVTLFSITTIQVSLMCRRSVDFHEPIYHRLLNLWGLTETVLGGEGLCLKESVLALLGIGFSVGQKLYWRLPEVKIADHDDTRIPNSIK